MPTRSIVLRIAILALVVAIPVVVAVRMGLVGDGGAQRLLALLREVRASDAAPPLFILAFGVFNSVGLPGLPFTLAAGAVFGWAGGAALSWLGQMLGALGAYMVARTLGGDVVPRLLGRRAHLVSHASLQSGWNLLRLRLIQVVPHNLINLASGLARSPVRAFLASTAIGILPGTLIYTYFAASLLAGLAGAEERALANIAVASALLITLSFLPALARRVRRRGAPEARADLVPSRGTESPASSTPGPAAP